MDIDGLIERLKIMGRYNSDAEEAASALRELQGERDDLRQVATLTLRERDALKAEVAHWRQARNDALKAGDVLKAENEKLHIHVSNLLHHICDLWTHEDDCPFSGDDLDGLGDGDCTCGLSEIIAARGE